MRVVDTSAWIECIRGSKLGDVLSNELPPRHEWIVPTIVQLELAKWAMREAHPEKAEELIAFSTTCIVVDLDATIALLAAELGALHALATADAIVYATTLAHEADLLTCDGHFKNLPGVRYVPKGR